jgi:hypothetical protein
MSVFDPQYTPICFGRVPLDRSDIKFLADCRPRLRIAWQSARQSNDDWSSDRSQARTAKSSFLCIFTPQLIRN